MAGDRLGRLIRLEPHCSAPRAPSPVFVAQTVVAKHQIVMPLADFGINRENRLQRLHRLSVFPLQKKNARQIVERKRGRANTG